LASKAAKTPSKKKRLSTGDLLTVGQGLERKQKDRGERFMPTGQSKSRLEGGTPVGLS